MCDVNTGKESSLGSHDKAVRSLVYNANRELLVSGSWDSTVKFWDARSSTCTASCPLPNKVFAMAGTDQRIVVGLAGRQVLVYDLRNLSAPEQQRESSLKYQTRALSCFPDGTGFVVGSIEGRVAVEFFDPKPEAQAQKYAFKCHRSSANGVDTTYPVNAIAFHKQFGTFATGGCDGQIYVWDAKNKKRLCQLRKYPTSIAGIAFNESGTAMAVASSYTFEEGEKQGVPPDQLFIRAVNEAEVKPKQKPQQ